MPVEERLTARAPFDLEATVRVLQRRPSNRLDVWERNRYLRVLPLAGGHVLAAVTDHGTVDRPELRFTLLAEQGALPGGERTAAVAPLLTEMLGLDVDPERLGRVGASEPALADAARALRGMRPPRFANLFETFLNVIPFQQLSLDAGIAIVARLVERFGPALDYRGRRFHGSPPSDAIAAARSETLRACGLSRSKADALRSVARAIASGELDAGRIERMATNDALRVLMQLPGIGPWSAALVLLRGFRRLEVFPPGDVGAQRSLCALLHVDAEELQARVERCGDLRGYLYFFGLGASLLHSGSIAAAPHYE